MANRVLYIAAIDLDDQFSGITRKVMTQFKVLCCHFEGVLVGYSQKGIVSFENNTFTLLNGEKNKRRLALCKVAKEIMATGRVDYVYIRRFPCNPISIDLLKSAHQYCKKVLWEIPTYPYDHESNLSFKSKILLYIDRYYRKHLKKYVDRIVTFAPDQEIFGIKTINTSNGIDVSSLRERKVKALDNDIVLIAVAVLKPWHGYDRIIRGLAEYYKQEHKKRNVYFYIVGDGVCLEEYKNLARELLVDGYIRFFGKCNKEQVEEIYDMADIAVESLGWHRSQVHSGTSLKVREYMAKGLPVIASSTIDIFPQGWKYAYYAPIDDTPVDISGVVSFYQVLLESQSRQEIADTIRDIAKRKCDMKVTMKPIVDYFEGGN